MCSEQGFRPSCNEIWGFRTFRVPLSEHDKDYSNNYHLSSEFRVYGLGNPKLNKTQEFRKLHFKHSRRRFGYLGRRFLS